jgi:malonyl-CoA O-methyltransferase
MRLAERLDYVKLDAQHVADIGCATGDGARELQRRYPEAQVLAMDYALPMLQGIKRYQRSSSWLARLTQRNRAPACVAADARAVPLSATSLELIWSNLVLHWLDNPEPAWREFARVLKTGGLLMFSMLGPDTLRELRLAAASCGIEIPLRRFYDMHDIGDQLVGAGFADPVMDMEYIGFTYRNARTFLADQRHLGVRDALLGKLGFRQWRAIIRQWERQRGEQGLPLTFEIVYGHAWRAEPRKTADGHTIVQFHRK